MNKTQTISIYDFMDYRQFLQEYYLQQKTSNPAFSYRYFAQKAGFNSSGLYKDIVAGRTGITRGLILKFAHAMKLTSRQQEYFELLVYFNDAKTADEKTLYFERMIKFRNSRACKVGKDQYEYYSKWYYIVVRELFSAGNFNDNYTAIAKSLNPAIRKEEAENAVEVLQNLGLIQKDADGYYRAVEKILTNGPDVKSMTIAKFQKAMMDIAKDAIDRHPASHRDISTITFSVSQKTYDEIKTELIACRKRILNMVAQSKNEDRVGQLNMQLFPLTKVKE